MNDIVRQFDKTWQGEDLFQAWQDEVQLRSQLRQCPTGTVRLATDNNILDFLYRGLYYSRRRDFFNIVLWNMNDLNTCKWVSSRLSLMREFLAYLPYRILEAKPDFRELQFLINIYRKEYRSDFTRIINVLDRSTCEELIKRSANKELRSLLRRRLTILQEHCSSLDYDIKSTIKTDYKYPTLFGDKLQLLLQAAVNLKTSQPYNELEPYQSTPWDKLLESAGIVFETGLVEDSLAILADAYTSYLDHNRTVNLGEETQVFQNLYKLLRRIVPMYALVSEPSSAYTHALAYYHNCFALVSPDSASLYFLKIYESIQEAILHPGPGIMAEISLKAASIKAQRPDDRFVLALHNWDEDSDSVHEIHAAAIERMRALPHEAFVILEFLRLWARSCPGCLNELNLLTDYIEIWKWAPSPLFMNQTVVSELGPYTDTKTRRQAGKILQNFRCTAGAGPETDGMAMLNANWQDLLIRSFLEVF